MSKFCGKSIVQKANVNKHQVMDNTSTAKFECSPLSFRCPQFYIKSVCSVFRKICIFNLNYSPRWRISSAAATNCGYCHLDESISCVSLKYFFQCKLCHAKLEKFSKHQTYEKKKKKPKKCIFKTKQRRKISLFLIINSKSRDIYEILTVIIRQRRAHHII